MRPSTTGLSDTARMLVKELIWTSTLKHNQGPKPNIFVFASSRGGSTGLMQLIEGEPGIRSINEPFSIHRGLTHAVKRVPRYNAGQVIAFNTAAEELAF